MLVAEVGLAVETAGTYQWSAALSGPGGEEIALGGATGFLGVGEQTVEVVFDGATIGAAGVDGPFTVASFLAYSRSTGANAFTSALGETRAYSVCDFAGAVCDTTPPAVTLAEPLALWPPNHAYATVAVADMVRSVVDPEAGPIDVAEVRIVAVSSDEPEDGPGDGATLEDIVIADDSRSVRLRQERQGTGNGRVYTVALAVADPAGNEAEAAYAVSVPRSRAHDAVDDGAAAGYTVAAGAPPAPRAAARVAERPSIRHFPNPVADAVTFEVVHPGGPAAITVYDVTGRVVLTVDLGATRPGPASVTADLSGLSPGIYFYALDAGPPRPTGRLVVVR